MFLKNNSYYKNYNNYYDLVKEKCVLYECGKNIDELFYRISKDFEFCNKNEIEPRKVYFDLTFKGTLKEKISLQRLFEDEEDLDILSYDDKCIFTYDDMYEIARLLDENNLGIFLIKDDDYYLERKPLLYWLSTNN